MGMFSKAREKAKAANANTIHSGLTKHYRLTDDAVVMQEGVTDSRVPYRKIESVSDGPASVTIRTPLREYVIEVNFGLTKPSDFRQWVQDLKDNIA